MLWIAAVVIAIVAVAVVASRVRGAKEARELVENSVDAEGLHHLLEPESKVLLIDVRLPLDVLAYSEMIPGARRIPPKEILADPTILPREKDIVMYCTCEAQKTSLEILRHVKTLGFSRVKVLRGGLAGWKAKGYPVELYRESFRLDTPI